MAVVMYFESCIIANVVSIVVADVLFKSKENL